MIVRPQSLLDYVIHLVVRMGLPYSDAKVVGQVVTEAELRGARSQGLTRLPGYWSMIASNRLNPTAEVRVVYQSPSTATVDADRALGHVAAHKAMGIAIEKARNAGTGWVAVRNSSHFGIAAYYAFMAVEQGMIGLVLSNGPAVVAPPNSPVRMLGTNPLSLAIPAHRQPPLVIDLSTSPTTPSRMELLAREGGRAPAGILQDALGEPTQDPSTLQRGGSILPLGGGDGQGHKGFCMAALVDLLASIPSGAAFGPFVPQATAHAPQNGKGFGAGVGHLFGAMRIDAFRPEQEARVAIDGWIAAFRQAQGRQGTKGVIIPGEPEHQMRQERLKSGIPLDEGVVKRIDRLAQQLAAEPISTLN